MRFILSMIITFSFISVSYASDINQIEALSPSDKIEVLWQSYLNEELDPVVFFSQMEGIQLKALTISNQLRVLKIEQYFSNRKENYVISVLEDLSEKEALKIASEWMFVGKLVAEVSSKNLAKIKKAKKYLETLKQFSPKTKSEVKDLFFNSPDYAYYNHGEYKNTLKVYLFCRHERRYPCLFVMRDIFDNEVRNTDGSLWTLPGLAHSRRELPYNITNGYTPSGVHTLDSVMPEANRQQAFGKWRRVKLNWIPKSKDEMNTKQFLPKSSYDQTWWHEANVARDVGRKWLRIHGTGNRNTDRTSSFYPHFATSGCISTREMEYDGVDYKDQRVILDTMMSAMQLAPIYANEVDIKGVIYVVELDDKKEKVTAQTLKTYGIE
jgi:nitroreductase